METRTNIADVYRRLQDDKNHEISGQLHYLYETIVNEEYVDCLELGGGRSTFAHLAAVNETGGSLVTVDIDGYELYSKRGDLVNVSFDLLTKSPNWDIIQGDSIMVAKTFLTESLDYIFIDTDHTYWRTSNELIAWYPILRPGGTIILHDIYDGKPFNNIPKPRNAGIVKVRKALDEFASGIDKKPIYIEENYGLGILKK